MTWVQAHLAATATALLEPRLMMQQVSDHNVHDDCYEHCLNHLNVVPGVTKAAAAEMREEEAWTGCAQICNNPQGYCDEVKHIGLQSQPLLQSLLV